MRHTAFAILTAALGVAGWRCVDPVPRPTAGIESISGERIQWIDPELSPVGVAGQLATAEILIVGDSRVAHAVHLSAIERLGVGAVALVWLSSARLDQLLAPLVTLEPPRTVVACLAPLGLVGYPQNLAIAETLRAPHPAADPTAPPHVVRAWAKTERAHLISTGFDEAFADRTLAWWQASHQLARRVWLGEQRYFDTRAFDVKLAHRVDRARCIALKPIEPQTWQFAWYQVARPHGSDRTYTNIVAPERTAERAAGAARVTALMRALLERGFDVRCVRLPIEPGLRAIEDSTGAAEVLAAIPEELGIPYRDFGAWEGATTDGSHLHWLAADRLTRELAEWLRETPPAPALTNR